MKANFAKAMDLLPDAVIWFDRDANLVEVNATGLKMWGYEKSELQGMTVFDINPNMNKENWTAHWEDKVMHSKTFESSHRRANGEVFPVEIMDHLTEIDGQVLSCAIIRDISDRKRKEAALRGALMEIKELKSKLEAENNYLQEEIQVGNNFGEIISQSPAFKPLLRQIQQVAPTMSTVLIGGESGTGKELIARALHRLSPRSGRPMIKVNCAALPPNLIESELFGHEKGAFTGAISSKIGKFELADGGTLFLDEIGEMPLDLQPKILRALQEGEIEKVGGQGHQLVDVRIIAATNRQLAKEVEKGKFREDLFYRLNVFPLEVPPLRERMDDIPVLVRFLAQKLSKKLGKPITDIPQKVLDKLGTYDFPGNVRELENLIERAIITSRGNKLTLGAWFNPKPSKAKPMHFATIEEVQRKHIIAVLQHTKWKVSGASGAAEILGMRPTTLQSRIDKLGIKRSNKVER